MRNISIDLETLGVTPGSIILSIGLAVFDKNGVGKNTFYEEIRQSSCRQAGLTEDPQTLAWWHERESDVQAILHRTNGGTTAKSLGGVLYRAAVWMYENTDSENFKIWANGADFDLPILEAAYRACGFDGAPWKNYNGRCYRTLKNLVPGLKINRIGSHHNAVDDALSQAEHAVRLFNHLGIDP